MRFISYILHKNYRLSSAVKFWIRRKFTPAGALILMGTIVLGGVGIDTNQALAYQAFVLLAVVLTISFIWSFIPAPRFSATRLLPRVGTADQVLHYKMTVHNPSRDTQYSVTVTEDFGDPRPNFAEFINTPEPGERRRNPFDRFFKFYRWMWLIERKQIATSVPANLPPVPARDQVHAPMRLIAKKRGHLRLEGLTFAVTDPFGLCRRYSRFRARQSVLILPRRYALPPIQLGGASQYQPGGVSLASSVGESEEFLSVREYRRGDPQRHIHWKSTGRTGKLIVKEFQNEYYVRHALVLDTFADNSSSHLFEEAVSIAASFGYTLNTQESLLDLLFVGPEAFTVTTGHGVAQVDHMLEILAAVQPCSTHTFSALEEVVLRQIALVSGCVCIFLKWDENRKNLVDEMSMLGIPLLVLVLKRPGAKDPRIELRKEAWTRVRIIDTGKTAEELSRL